jgi:hypothetical protein
MNWLLAGVASVGFLVCATAFVLFATSSLWAFVIVAVVVGVCLYAAWPSTKAKAPGDITRGKAGSR